mmetsp:Transcript_130874/g.240725  ORF Transcript_130874/g.240725 Transcript_130874/m.240725 type:complete len:749 (+) Transcript_130874:78-2324(+)
MMVFDLPSRPLLLLLILTFSCCSLASDTDFICSRTVSLNEKNHIDTHPAAAIGASVCLQISQLDEITGAFFVQRHAMRYVAGVSVHSNVSHPSDTANIMTKRTANSLPANLVQYHCQYDVVNEDILAASILTRGSRHISSAVALEHRHHKVPSASESRFFGEKLCLAAVCVCVFVALYFYFSGSNTPASEASSNDVSDKPSIPPEAAPVRDSVSESRSARDVVEDLGFGTAQLWILFLANGVWFLDGWELALVNTVATSTALDMGLNAYGRAMLSSLAMLGLIPGCMLGGWLGDKLGRKPPIIASYIAVAIVSWGTSLAPDARSLLGLRACMGIACGLGMPSSTVMMSELAPARRRGTMIAGRGVLYTTGIITAQLVCLGLDPTLEQLNWRLCFMMVLPPTLLFLVPTCLYMYESPLFFACIGDHKNAKLAFEHMRQLNSCPEVSISYTDSTLTFDLYEDSSWTGPFWNNMSVLFSYGVFGCTLALTLLRLLEVFAYMARNYGMTRVFIVEAESMDLTPGLQVLVARLWGFAALLFPLTLDRLLSRKGMLFVSLSTLAIAYSAFAWSEHSDQENWEVSTMLQTSIAVERFMLKVISMISSIVIVECFPTEMRTTSYALIGILGKFAGIAGPVMFEWFYMQFHMVTAFFYFLSGFAFFVGLTVVCLLPGNLEIPQLIASERLKAMRLEGGSHQVLASAAETPAEEASVEEPAKEAPAEELPAERAPSRQETPVEVRAHRSPRSQKCVAM